MGSVEQLHEGSLMRSVGRRAELRMVMGGIILGRETGMSVSARDFAGSPIILHMSVRPIGETDAYKRTNAGKVETITRAARPGTTINEIILAVLKVTHKDLSAQEKPHLCELLSEGAKEFGQFYPGHVHQIRHVLDEVTERTQNCDFLRGVDAFREATTDQHGLTYEETILEPARRFAQYLVAIERSDLK